jgi:signal transduction histidine kinase
MEMAPSEVAIERVIYETMEQLEGRFVGTSVRPHVTMPPRLRPIQSDEQKLRQVLINLIGNAIKFTEHGSITVAVHVDEHDVPIRIDVTDTGIGIPHHRLASIFDTFEQGDASTGRRFGGTGLGLTISRALCRLLGYRLTVVSEVGVGSTFSVLLAESAAAPTRVRPDAGAPPAS